MEIVPNSTLYILKNVPLDKTYDHTIYFANKAAQEAAFIAKKKFKCGAQGDLSALTYVRVNRGVIRVGIPSEQLYDCNYLMFQNKGFQQSGQGDRWFYAFIESVEYINNTTSEIRFSIDVMQTWYFDYTVEDCFVVREHSTTDVAGDNLLPETVDVGDYIVSNVKDIYDDDTPNVSLFTDWVICMCRTTANWAGGLPILSGVKFYGNLLTGGEFVTYELNATGLSNLRQDLGNLGLFHTDRSIVSLFMCPRKFIPTASDTPKASSRGNFTLTAPLAIGNYTPRNKKLLTFPYTKFTIDNCEGNAVDFHYEDFSNVTGIQFDWRASLYDKPNIVVRPIGYRGGGVDTQYAVIKTDFPSIIYATSDVGAKIIQAGIGVAMSALTAGGATGSTIATETVQYRERTRGEHGRLVIGQSQELERTKTTTYTSPEMTQNDAVRQFLNFAQNMGSVYPSIGRGSNLYDCGLFRFLIRQSHIREEFAQIIDEYFDRYGYACKRNKVPNTHARKHWTYTQTANCTIAGSMPADDEAKICSIYNSGITFWNNMNEVGEYTTYASDNTPL